MASCVNIGKFWDEKWSIQKASTFSGIDKKTLSIARRGFLDRCKLDTLIALRGLASEMAGRQVMLEELLVIGEEEK